MPGKTKADEFCGPNLAHTGSVPSEHKLEELSGEVDKACARASTGKFSFARWVAGALAISGRGRGPRVAQRWLGSEGRHAPPPQMGAAEDGEAEGGEPKGGESDGEGEAESSSYESSYSYYSTEAETE